MSFSYPLYDRQQGWTTALVAVRDQNTSFQRRLAQYRIRLSRLLSSRDTLCRWLRAVAISQSQPLHHALPKRSVAKARLLETRKQTGLLRTWFSQEFTAKWRLYYRVRHKYSYLGPFYLSRPTKIMSLSNIRS